MLRTLHLSPMWWSFRDIFLSGSCLAQSFFSVLNLPSFGVPCGTLCGSFCNGQKPMVASGCKLRKYSLFRMLRWSHALLALTSERARALVMLQVCHVAGKAGSSSQGAQPLCKLNFSLGSSGSLINYHDFISTVYHPISSYIILYHPISSYIILYHPISSYIILYRPISSYIVLYHPISSYIVLYHPISSYIILYRPISSYIILYRSISSYIVLYHPISSYIILYRPISSYIVLYHPISSYIVLYHPISSYIILYRPISSYIILYRPI